MLTYDDVVILRALCRGDWRYPGEIADETDMPSWKVRGRLRDMACERVVVRGSLAQNGHWGEYSITGKGLEQLAAASQLRIVE